jgi:hypothetical protein
VVVPAAARVALFLRTLIQPLIERQTFQYAAEADEGFLRDIEERGLAAASGPVGPGGLAALRVQPETPRGGEAETVAETEREPAAG